MLQVIEGSAVGDRRNHGSQLQGRHGDAFAEGAHLANTAEFGGNFGIRIGTKMFARKSITREFSQSELMRVVAHLFKTKLASKSLEICVVRVRQGIGQIHAA